jgi:hypothetical protein
MNYAELSSVVKAYCENEFPQTTGELTSTQQIDTFIRQAEQRIYNTVQFSILRKNVDGVLSTGNKYLNAPVDFLAVYSLAVIDASGNFEYLLNKDVNFLRAAFPNPADTGLPQYYALFGAVTTNDPIPTLTNELTLIVGPTPNDNYAVELHYYYYPESIVTAGNTWLGDNFDSVLLYGALIEAATFMKSEAEVLAGYTARYTEALGLAKRLGDGMERTDAYRSGQIRYPVR